MGFLRTVAAASTTTAVTAAALAFNSLSLSPSSSSSSSSYNFNLTKPFFISTSSIANRSMTLTNPPSALQMDTKPAPKHDAELPEVMTEFMVDMSCEGCVKSVKNKLQTVDGIKSIDVDLSNQVVRIFGSSPVKAMAEALEQTGRKASLIGQGSPGDVLISAAVAEFKGPQIFGVVRLAQVSMELARIEANFSGLSPGKHGWSINEFGDLTQGVQSTGKLFNPSKQLSEPLGDLGTLDVDEKGEAFFSGVKKNLTIADLIGRAIAVYENEDRSDAGLAAAVVARSAGVGENYKKLCTCDGTTIWEATNADYVPSKV